jgi:hypothetical protein
MLYSSHGDVQEQENTTPQAALKAACGCGATCLFCSDVQQISGMIAELQPQGWGGFFLRKGQRAQRIGR